MHDHDPFLRAIAADPDDKSARLIYADWLEERGDMRAEFIRLHARLAEQPEDEEFFRLLDREQAIRAGVDPAWLGALGYKDPYAHLFRLDEGLWLEDSHVMLRWGMTNEDLSRCGNPRRRVLPMSLGEQLTWSNCVFWRGMRGYIVARFEPSPTGIPTTLNTLFGTQPRMIDFHQHETIRSTRALELRCRFGTPTIEDHAPTGVNLVQPARRLEWKLGMIGLTYAAREFGESGMAQEMLRLFVQSANSTT